jgi:glycerol-3-phosphate acyltransferase PlsY
MTIHSALLSLLFGYLLGSIPFGYLLTKYTSGLDIRSLGSGNIGATNVLRTGNKLSALATLFLDGAKGAFAVLLVRWFFPEQNELLLITGLGSILGHLFPCWLGFKGGKGVATGIGVFLAVSMPLGLAVIGTWLIVALVFRISSAAALAGFLCAPFFSLWLREWETAVWAAFIAILIIFKHQENIKRIFSGKEPKIGHKSFS